MKEKIKILILAAGKGVRMKSDLPKALTKVKGKSMIERLLDSVLEANLDPRPSIVVGFGKEEIKSALGDKYDYIEQLEQLGTGHAVLSAEKALEGKAEDIMVLPSDHPYVSRDTIRKLAKMHAESGSKITMATVKLPDFEDWRAFFYTNFSRIVRGQNGEIMKSVEFKDASEEEKKITEVNPILFCFEERWLWQNIKTLKRENAQREYYLTDLIEIAVREKIKIESVEIDPVEALAANSKEELEMLEKFAT